jgi:hypothetical protein
VNLNFVNKRILRSLESCVNLGEIGFELSQRQARMMEDKPKVNIKELFRERNGKQFLNVVARELSLIFYENLF